MHSLKALTHDNQIRRNVRHAGDDTRVATVCGLCAMGIALAAYAALPVALIVGVGLFSLVELWPKDRDN